MTPRLLYLVDGDGNNDHELDGDDLVIPDKPPLSDRPAQLHSSNIPKSTSTLPKVQTFECPPRSSRSRSPQKVSALGSSLPSVPAVETGQLPLEANIASYNLPKLRKSPLKEQLRKDELESKSQDNLNKLDMVRSHPHYQQLQRDLEEESSHRKQLENELSERETLLAEILSKSESDLVEKNRELDEVRKGWRKLAGELNKIRAQGQGFYQVTDAYLIEKTNSLRYSVRNFAIQYFDGKMKHSVEIEYGDFVKRYIEPTTPLHPKAYLDLSISPTMCSSLIQGIIWRVLTGDVFNQFRWAGKVAEDVWHLHQTLSQSKLSSTSVSLLQSSQCWKKMPRFRSALEWSFLFLGNILELDQTKETVC